MKKYDYGHLEEIKVRRDDQKLYTFKEGDFKRLRLQDIEDLLLLLSALYDIAAGIRMEYLPMRKRSNLAKKRARVAALSEEVDAESREVRWWKGIRE
ncbi:hypothetical protein Tco_0668561 [Tanacetum coccineum]